MSPTICDHLAEAESWEGPLGTAQRPRRVLVNDYSVCNWLFRLPSVGSGRHAIYLFRSLYVPRSADITTPDEYQIRIVELAAGHRIIPSYPGSWKGPTHEFVHEESHVVSFESDLHASALVSFAAKACVEGRLPTCSTRRGRGEQANWLSDLLALVFREMASAWFE